MVGRTGRTLFTESDDDNLTEYIAKARPTISGRQGNTIYISLEESVNQRPWANRHSWQSWRERYRKNQDWFNHQIKKYQKKRKENASEKKTDDRDELYTELFGISQFSEDGDDDEIDEKSLVPSSFDDIQESAPKPASKPATSSGQKSSAVIALKPPQLSEGSRNQSNVPKRLIAPSFDNVLKNETVSPAQEFASKPAISSGKKPSAPIAPKPPQLSEDGKDESDVHKILLAPPFDDMVKIETVPPAQEPASKPTISSGQETSATAAEIALKPPRQSKSKKIISRDDDSQFFGTPSVSPSPSPLAANSTPRGEPPILTQGFYRSSFKRPRAAFGNVTNDESWPPKRRKKMAKKVNPDVEMPDACGMVEANKASLPAEGSTNGVIRHRPPAQVNAVASSSKVLLSDTPHRPAKPTNLLKVIYAKSDTSHVHTDAPSLPKAIQDTNLPFVKKNHDGSVTGSDSRNSVPIKSVHRLISSPDDDVDHQLARLSSVDINDDPFIIDKHTTTTSPVRNFILPPRRIDLRKSLDATRSRRSRTSTTTSSISRHSNNLSFLLPEDRAIFSQVGLQKVMAVIAKNYGFDVDVAMKAFFATKSIEKTKSLLQFAKEVTNSATSALLSNLVNGDDIDSSDDDEAPQNMLRSGHNNGSPPSGTDQQRRALTNSGRQNAKRSSDGSRRKSNRLSIKPRPFEEIDETALSDYSPPRVSRAGQFLRLVKEGRREEAVDRERRRASGAFVVQTQTQAQRHDDEDDHQQSQQLPLSRMPNTSPSLISPGQKPAVDKIDTCNVDDDIQPPIVAPHKEDIVIQEHRDQPPDDENDNHHHRVFFKRISEGQSSLNEDEDNPEVLKLAQEHRDLVMNVMEDNADELRSFEQRNNQDLLRLWSLDWVKQKIADMS